MFIVKLEPFATVRIASRKIKQTVGGVTHPFTDGTERFREPLFNFFVVILCFAKHLQFSHIWCWRLAVKYLQMDIY